MYNFAFVILLFWENSSLISHSGYNALHKTETQWRCCLTEA